MRTFKYKWETAIAGVLILVLFSCKKDGTTFTKLSGSNVYFKESVEQHNDSIDYLLNATKDSISTVTLHIAAKNMSPGVHTAIIGIDTSAARLDSCRARYGQDIQFLPSQFYAIALGNTELPLQLQNGDSVFSPAEINFINESNLNASKTYILPVVIDSLDNAAVSYANQQVIYIVVEPYTNYGIEIDRSSWTVIDSSAETPGEDMYGSPLFSILDNSTATGWLLYPVPSFPQYFTIDMRQPTNLSSIRYTGFSYYVPNMTVNILTSNDSINWTDDGTFPETTTLLADYSFLLKLNAPVTARYFKFNVVSAGLDLGFNSLILVCVGEIYAYKPL